MPSSQMRSAQLRDAIVIYCDGACSGNQSSRNIGGWGAVLQYRGRVKEIHGGERNTSNQRMELTACIKALETVTSKNIPIEIHSDSAYLVNCMREKWYLQWQKNGWKTAKKHPVENQDLWKHLLDLLSAQSVRFHKVEGHAGIRLNERADQLAQGGIREFSRGL